MSISDLLVVMKTGIIQQIGKPQEVYDSPANLFVAKFLGTPPINVFEGRVTDGRLCIGEDEVLKVDIEDRPVYVGIRPEGFVPETARKKIALTCDVSNVEVMGRDVSIVSTHPAMLTPSVRSIIDSDYKVDREVGTIKFALKPHKVFLFDRETEERIYFGDQAPLSLPEFCEAEKSAVEEN